nr:putative integron gene cassette protein [uncultured bacterium]
MTSNVRPHMKNWLFLASLLLIAACNSHNPAPPETAVSIQPPDVGDIDRFLNCSAKPRRELSPREKCEVAAFRSRCTALDDCYVSCISSPTGSFVGGRCAHVCTMGPHPGAQQPEPLTQCANLTGRSGVDVD